MMKTSVTAMRSPKLLRHCAIWWLITADLGFRYPYVPGSKSDKRNTCYGTFRVCQCTGGSTSYTDITCEIECRVIRPQRESQIMLYFGLAACTSCSLVLNTLPWPRTSLPARLRTLPLSQRIIRRYRYELCSSHDPSFPARGFVTSVRLPGRMVS